MNNPVQKSNKTINYKAKAESKSLYETLGNKVPPNSADAEKAVLGGLLLSKSAFHRVQDIITEESFYFDSHREIFMAIQTLFKANKPIDLLTLSDELEKNGKKEQIGGDTFLAELYRRTPSSANVEFHALIVLEKYLKRLLIEKSAQIISNAFDEEKDILEEIDKAESEIFKISQKGFSKSYRKMSDIAKTALANILTIRERGSGGYSGIPSGLRALDDMTGGFQNSDLVIIAARPSMGKTAFGLSIILNIAVKSKIPVAFFSLEMSADQIAIRLVSAQTKINQQTIRTGRLNQTENTQIVEGFGVLSDSNIVIDDSAMMNIMELRSKCRKMVNESKVRMIIVDYLQLLQAPKAESREREISIISQTLKQIAKELNIPVLALAQLNRSVENRKDFRPMLQDLRESGSIEQDADVVMFVHRPERFGKDTMYDGTPSKGMAEIIIGKQRNGPTGSIKLAFQEDYAKFENFMLQGEPPPQSMKDSYLRELNSIPDDIDDSPF